MSMVNGFARINRYRFTIGLNRATGIVPTRQVFVHHPELRAA